MKTIRKGVTDVGSVPNRWCVVRHRDVALYRHCNVSRSKRKVVQSKRKGGDVRMPEDTAKVTLFISRNLHSLMKELAKRRRVTLGNLYDQCLAFYLKQPANYMSSKRERQLRKVQ